MATFTPLPKNAMDNAKLGIAGQPWAADNPRVFPKMSLRHVNNSVWITAFLNHPDEPDDIGPVNIKMDPVIANTFLATIVEAIEHPENFETIGVENNNYTFNAGQRSDKPTKQGTAFASVNGDGEICVILQYPDRKTSVYPFRSTFWYALVTKTGQPSDKARVSKLVARGWVNTMRDLMPAVGNSIYKHPEPKPKQTYSKTGSGGYSGGGGNQQVANDSGTDVFADMG